MYTNFSKTDPTFHLCSVKFSSCVTNTSFPLILWGGDCLYEGHSYIFLSTSFLLDLNNSFISHKILSTLSLFTQTEGPIFRLFRNRLNLYERYCHANTKNFYMGNLGASKFSKGILCFRSYWIFFSQVYVTNAHFM